jgi:hypothetical protein
MTGVGVLDVPYMYSMAVMKVRGELLYHEIRNSFWNMQII